MKHTILFLSLWLTLPGCMKVKSKESAAEAPAAPNVAPEISYKVITGEGPNQYQIEFRFARPVSSAYLIKSYSGHKESIWIPVKNQIWRDENIGTNLNLTYQFGQMDKAHFESWQEISLRSPADLVIENRVKWNDEIFAEDFAETSATLSLNRYGRIYLRPGGVLELEDRSVEIAARELISDGGIIETFPEGATAAVGHDGRSGGRISLSIGRAQGRLRVEMRGENGGAGLPGREPDAGNKGQTGAPGAPGEVLEISPEGEQITGRAICTKPPGPGGPGLKGLNGYPGENGHRGGNSGEFRLVAADTKDFAWTGFKTIGRGGNPGEGGRGGEGGDGGAPGEVRITLGYLLMCHLVKGPAGPRGESGARGAPGADGSAGGLCEIKPDQTKNCY